MIADCIVSWRSVGCSTQVSTAATRAILDAADAAASAASRGASSGGAPGRGATPLVAIGGINAANAAACVAPLLPTTAIVARGDGDGDGDGDGVGGARRRRLADGVAVVSAILGADDPRAAAAELSDAIATAHTPDDPAGGVVVVRPPAESEERPGFRDVVRNSRRSRWRNRTVRRRQGERSPEPAVASAHCARHYVHT